MTPAERTAALARVGIEATDATDTGREVLNAAYLLGRRLGHTADALLFAEPYCDAGKPDAGTMAHAAHHLRIEAAAVLAIAVELAVCAGRLEELASTQGDVESAGLKKPAEDEQH